MSAPEFKAASQLLEFCAASPAHAARGRKVARALCREHAPLLTAALGGDQRKSVVAALALLRAALAASPSLAGEIAQLLGGALPGLQQHTLRDRSGAPIPPTAAPAELVELVLALLDAGDRAVLVQLLSGEQRRLATLPLFLLARLPRALQLRALGVLRRRVLDNRTLPMRCRLAVCPVALQRLGAVLADAADDADGGGGGADGADGGGLGATTHGFLMRVIALSCTPKEGGDAASDAAPPALQPLLLALRPTADPAQQRLLLTALRAAPALLPEFVRSRGGAGGAADPRPATAWLAAIAFGCRLLAVAAEHAARTMRRGALETSKGGADPLGLDAVVPPVLSRPLLSRALLHTSPLVRCFALNALLALLGALAAVRRAAVAAGVAPAEAEAALRRRLPDAQLLLSVHLKLKTAEAAAPTRLGALMQARLLDALRRYGALVPHRAAEARLAPEKLLGPAPTPPVVQHATALLLADTTAAAELLPAPALCAALTQYARARGAPVLRRALRRLPRGAAHRDGRAERRRRRRGVGVAAPADAARRAVRRRPAARDAPRPLRLRRPRRRLVVEQRGRRRRLLDDGGPQRARRERNPAAATAPHVLGRRRRRRGCVPLRCARMPRTPRRGGVDQRGAR